MIRDGGLCRRFVHWPKVHRTGGGGALVVCRVCGRRLQWFSSDSVRGMLPGELDEHVRRCRYVAGGEIEIEALKIGARK